MVYRVKPSSLEVAEAGVALFSVVRGTKLSLFSSNVDVTHGVTNTI